MFRLGPTFTIGSPLLATALSNSGLHAHVHGHPSYGALQRTLLRRTLLHSALVRPRRRLMRLDDNKAFLPSVHNGPHSRSAVDIFAPSSPRAFKSGTQQVAEIPHELQHKPVPFVGFWSLQDYEKAHEEVHEEHDEQSYEQDPQNALDRHPASAAGTEHQALNFSGSETFRRRWHASRPKKIDLSYYNPITLELSKQYPTKRQGESAPAFRASAESSGSRQITKYLLEHDVYSHVSPEHGLPDNLAIGLLHRIASFEFHRGPIDIDEAFSCSWILSADTVTSIKRLVALTRHRHHMNLPPLPQWIIMQVLRSSRIDAKSLTDLIVLVKDRHTSWTWMEDQPMLLAVRLLRHARRSAAPCFDAIVDLFLLLVRPRRSTPRAVKKMAHWCNRILSLIAIPVSHSPFRSMYAQQVAQLALVRYMQDSEPQLPLMREGYRAIAKLQLMHEKTPQETEWASAKARTWPPWQEQNRMASVAGPSHYPGKRTRVRRVLERMQESGYAPTNYDLAVRIMTGWDTDDSPTTQVRRTAASISIPQPWEPGPGLDTVVYSPLIWSARVEATRTLREAWMCFSSYQAAASENPPSERVYHALFRKLFARTVSYSPDGPWPGDGTELYPDPDLARDRVYIPEEIPSIRGLFTKMLAQDLRPSTRLLSDLLKHETNLLQGLHYVSYAAIEEEKKQILASPWNHPSEHVARVLMALPSNLVQSYVGFLARPHPRVSAHERRPVFDGRSGPAYAKCLLDQMRLRDISVLNVYLYSLTCHVGPQQLPFATHHKDPVHVIWTLACQAISNLTMATPVDFTTFTHAAMIAYSVESSSWDGAEHARDADEPPTLVAKRLFQTAAGAYNASHPISWQEFCRADRTMRSLPPGAAIEDMVWVLGSTHGYKVAGDVLALLHWVRYHQERILAAGHHITKHNLAVFRFFLEARWADEEDWQTLQEGRHFMNSTQRQELQGIAEELGAWPDDRYMEKYMCIQQGRANRLRRKYKVSRGAGLQPETHDAFQA